MLDGDVTDSVEGHSFTHSLQVNDIFSCRYCTGLFTTAMPFVAVYLLCCLFICSWGPDDDGKTVDGPQTLAMVGIIRQLCCSVLCYLLCQYSLH